MNVRTMTHTYTRTYNVRHYADPYKKCLKCDGWIDGALVKGEGEGPLTVVPCEHQDGYRDVCPSWGPVDGCTCAEAGIVHDMRPQGGDDREYGNGRYKS